ncbi:hypothetical protein QAD02_014916 [Eretmocerus hayati]|uniref:Uncharacterized protein n=1 Tax=Eretmocerus hayati TaxID=131215 RepID=A0ACC2P944_9HYME|nr:hypothetical protein QAD02_014916 [Eretmocerus hayati]
MLYWNSENYRLGESSKNYLAKELIIVVAIGDNRMEQDYVRKYPFHIVEFKKRGRQTGKKWLDVVGSHCFHISKASGKKEDISNPRKPKKVQVYFPPPPYTEETYKNYNKALSELSGPLKEWQLFNVKVKARAENLPEALEKLSQLKNDENGWSTCDATPEECEAKAVAALRQAQLMAKSNALTQKFQSAMPSVHHASHNPPIDMDSDDDEATDGLKSLVESSNMSRNDSLNSSPTTVDGGETQNPGVLTSFVSKPQAKASLTKQQKGSVKPPKTSSKSSCSSEGDSGLLATLVVEVQGLRKDVKDLNDNFENLKKAVTDKSDIVRKDFIGTRHQLGEAFKYQFPLPTLEEFDRFNLELANPKSALKKHLLVVLEAGLDCKFVVSKSTINMMRMFIDKSVALQYVGCKPVANKSKDRLMVNTEFYKCMDLLIRNHRTLNKITTGLKEISSAVGSNLSNAKSWKIEPPVGHITIPTDTSAASVSTVTEAKTSTNQPQPVDTPILITVPHQNSIITFNPSSHDGRTLPVFVEEISEPSSKRMRLDNDPSSAASNQSSSYSILAENSDDQGESSSNDDSDEDSDSAGFIASLQGDNSAED